MTALSDRLEYPNIRPVALLEIVAGEWLKYWTLAEGKTHTYYASTNRRVVGVNENGAPLNSLPSIGAVESNSGSYHWDQSNGRVYIHPSDSSTPYGKTVQARVLFLFSTECRVINGMYYDGRIISLPDLTARIEAMFGEPGKVGAGKVDLAGGDGYFDALNDIQWDSGEAILKLGIDEIVRDLPLGQGVDGAIAESGGELYADTGGGTLAEIPSAMAPVRVYRQCDYSDYETVAGVRIVGWSHSASVFSIELEEKKSALKRKIPVDVWTLDAYPNMDESRAGDPIPIVYGTVYDVSPTCIDKTTNTFKVANHPIKEFIAVRVKKKATEDAETPTWVGVSFATNDESTAQFTLSADDWDGDAEVAVDFRGRTNPDGSLMVNPADVVKDVLVTWLCEPESSIDAESFSASWSHYHIGIDSDGNAVTRMAMSLYLGEEDDASSIIGDICSVAGASFHHALDGKYRFVAWVPVPGESCLSFVDSEIQKLEVATDATEIFSSIRAGYQYREQQDYSQRVMYDRPESQYLQGANTAVVSDLGDLPLTSPDDAMYVCQRTARMRGERIRKYRARLSHRAWRLKPGEYIHVRFDEAGIDAVLEVLEVRRRLAGPLWVDVVLGDLRGMKDTPGYWVADSMTFPMRLGGGSCEEWNPSWTAAQKSWARQNCGYWLDDNGFADSTDPDSYMAGAWI